MKNENHIARCIPQNDKIREFMELKTLILSFRWWKIKWTKSSSMCIQQKSSSYTETGHEIFKGKLFVFCCVVWEVEKYQIDCTKSDECAYSPYIHQSFWKSYLHRGEHKNADLHEEIFFLYFFLIKCYYR